MYVKQFLIGSKQSMIIVKRMVPTLFAIGNENVREVVHARDRDAGWENLTEFRVCGVRVLSWVLAEDFHGK